MQTRKRVLTSLFELVRLPNIFTAPPDVAMGLAVSGAALTSSAATLLLASACAYAGGMALNDACDATLDARERPERPIPSGRITRAGAFPVAGLLLPLCLGLAAAPGLRPVLLALGLLLAIAVALFVLGWGPGGLTGLVFLALLAAWLGPPVRDAIADPAPRRIIGVIKAAVLGIILLDAAFTSASRGLVSGALVAACFVPAYVLGRRFASA